MTGNRNQVKDAFRAFSRSKDTGCIRRIDMTKALTKYGADRLTEQEAAELLQEVSE